MFETSFVQSQIQTYLFVWLATLWLLWLPGLLFSHLIGLRAGDILVRVAMQIGLGMAFWPLLLLWTSTFGWRWSATGARTAVFLLGFGGLAILIRKVYDVWKGNHLRLPRSTRWRSTRWLSLFGLIAIATIVTRLLHIRNLILPAWVDSVYHTMIVRVISAHGALPETYAPFLPSGRFFHHWGYHALVSWLAWFLGWTEPLQIPQLILHFGQVLNALTVLMLYAAGRVLFNSRRVGLLAAMLAGLISWFPAYFVTWGHYSQLAGLLILPIFRNRALAACIKSPSLGHWLMAVVLGAGLLATHVRVTFFALTLIAVLGAIICNLSRLAHRMALGLGWSSRAAD